MKICLIGAQGSGKGTLAEGLTKTLAIPAISSGDIFREHIKNNTDIGQVAQQYINKGILVPDDITTKMVIDYLNSKGLNDNFILDGFPRNVKQAKMFDQQFGFDKVIELAIDRSLLLNRLLNRVVCKKCGAIYNKNWYSKDTCEKCGGPISTRDDDYEAAINKRLDDYYKQTIKVVNNYKKQNLVVTIDASGTPERTLKDCLKALGIK